MSRWRNLIVILCDDDLIYIFIMNLFISMKIIIHTFSPYMLITLLICDVSELVNDACCLSVVHRCRDISSL